jgi:hypothetical protein
MWTAAGAEPISASRMERDLVFGKGLYQLVYGTLPIDLGVESARPERRAGSASKTWGCIS